MRLIAKKTLEDYWRQNGQARQSLQDWASMAKAASWSCMDDICRSAFGKPSPITDTRVVFNIRHNAYRLVADIDFERQVVYIKFIGTHAEYDVIDSSTVSRF